MHQDLKLAARTVGVIVTHYPLARTSDIVYAKTKHKRHLPGWAVEKIDNQYRRLQRDWLVCADEHRLDEEEDVRQAALRVSRYFKKGRIIVSERRI
jgi:hypothetical protein